MKITMPRLKQIIKEELKRTNLNEELYGADPTGEEMVQFLTSHGLEEEVAQAVARLLMVRDAKELLRQFRR